MMKKTPKALSSLIAEIDGAIKMAVEAGLPDTAAQLRAARLDLVLRAAAKRSERTASRLGGDTDESKKKKKRVAKRPLH